MGGKRTKQIEEFPDAVAGLRLDEKKLALILTRASEIEARGQDTAVPEGFSLDEAETIAREAGISGDSFHRAVAELESGRDGSGWVHRFFGNVHPGARVFVEKASGEESLEEIMDLLGNAARLRGSGTIRRGSLRWASDGFEVQRSGRMLDIAVTPAGEGMDISVEYDLKSMAGGVFGGLCGGLGLGGGLGVGFGVGMGAMNSPAFALIFSAAGFLGSFLLARGIFSLLSRRTQAEADRIAGLIAGLVEKKTPKA
jgi:hypothetical protein